MFTRNIARSLRAGTALSALTLATSLLAVPAFAQDTVPTTDQTAPATPAADEAPEIVVTGSLFATKVTQSPVTTVTAESLDARGISTVQDGLQRLAANNGPTLTNSFSANGAFAGGASAISLRGLSTNSTLVLFDGLRAAYYPLADDATRNFVDLNTIPDDIIDRIEVLKDGASSSYGADAIAGVVNIITKRSFTGLSARAEAGVSQDGIAATQRVSVTAGTGDLDRDGFNAYVSGFYYHADSVATRDLRSPFNSDDQTSIGGPNNQVNGDNFAANYTGFGSNLYVAPGSGGRYQLLAGGCANGTLTQTTAAQQGANALLPTSICQQDLTNRYGVVAPQVDRFGISAHVAKTIGDSAEAYLELNFQQSRSQYSGAASSIYANAPAGIDHEPFSTVGGGASFAPGSGALTLPVYVCAARVNCTAANGTLNPNNPFAASGQTATLIGAMPNLVRHDESRSRVYRAAAGIKGSFGDDWNYKVDATAMRSELRRSSTGYVYIQHLLDVIADGSYNFVDPSSNSQAVQDYLAPAHSTDASSELYQVQASVNKALFQLPGGPAQFGVGGSFFYEGVDSPSANSDANGPTERYFTINAFGTKGHRTVTSGFGELSLPVLKQLELNLSGRYDHYSTGPGYFSPKVGAKFTPVDMLTVRGTWSRGFRIPSFGESNSLPTTGYVNNSAKLFSDAYLAQYGCTADNFNTTNCASYLRNGSYGQTTLASPDLKPEKSRSITLGAVFQPMRNVSFSVDYFNIKKTDAITSLSSADALRAYYSGQAIPDGFTIITDAPDPAHPGATPRVAFVQSHYVNANKQKAEGIDFGANGRFHFGDVTWTTNLDATLMLELSTTLADGTRETYVDTLGNYNLTAGTGTFRWKGSWTNSFAIGNYTVSGTANYTSGYDLSAMDQGNAYEDCGLAPSPAYTGCRVKSYFTFDLNATAKIADKFTIYANVLNLFDRLPDYDPVTYGAYLYNPVQAGDGIYGRRFTVGAKINF